MAFLELRGISKRYEKGGEWALHPLDFTFESGKIYSLLGPSGCGKSTLLNIISGLIPPTEGDIFFKGEKITDHPTKDRNLAQVFQFPVIYKTMTVFQNLAFPLKNRKLGKDKINSLVHSMAELLSLSSIIHLKGLKLSPAQKQLVCLGRGLIRPDVRAILFDEPLTLLDSEEKTALRRAIKQVHQKIAPIFIYVTHDQNEALTMAHEIVVMKEGKVLQVGDSISLYKNPNHPFVGHFIGSPGMNFFTATRDDNYVNFGQQKFPIALINKKGPDDMDKSLLLGIRPESIKVSLFKEKINLKNCLLFEGVDILRVQDWGEDRVIVCEKGGKKFKVRTKKSERDLKNSSLTFFTSYPEITAYPNHPDYSFQEVE